MKSSSTRALLGTHDDRRESNQVYMTLAHHANQFVITDNYADREGIGEILGLGGPGDLGGYRGGFLHLLQMRLDYRIPLNLQLSGTLIEALPWRCPESFSLIKRLRHAGLLEMIGSAFSQNIMPFFSDEHNLRQINEELWRYRQHLDWDLGAVKTFWAPERVWDTEKLARLLRSGKLLNRGYSPSVRDSRDPFRHAGARTRQFLRVGFTWRYQNEKAVFLHISNNCGHPHVGGRDGAR